MKTKNIAVPPNFSVKSTKFDINNSFIGKIPYVAITGLTACLMPLAPVVVLTVGGFFMALYYEFQPYFRFMQKMDNPLQDIEKLLYEKDFKQALQELNIEFSVQNMSERDYLSSALLAMHDENKKLHRENNFLLKLFEENVAEPEE